MSEKFRSLVEFGNLHFLCKKLICIRLALRKVARKKKSFFLIDQHGSLCPTLVYDARDIGLVIYIYIYI